MSEKIEIKQGEVIETVDVAELSDEALDGIAGGAGGQTGGTKYMCETCGATLDGNVAMRQHVLKTKHTSFKII